MDFLTYKEVSAQEIIDFISLCYRIIGREIDIEGKDSDLMNIQKVYGDHNGNFFILQKQSVILGTIAIKFFQSPKGRIGEIHRFYVHPKHQRNGYGKELLKIVYNYAKEYEAIYLRATTEPSLKGAINIFQKYGGYEIVQYRKSDATAFFEKKIEGNIQTEDFSDFSENLEKSFSQLEQENKETLILNPVENYPEESILFPCASPIHGLYNTDSLRSNEQKILSKIQFSGRDRVTEDINNIYTHWAKLLGAQALTMRLLSGLHAHIVLFMAITNIGDRILLLPEIAGGHMATKSILSRLGLVVKEIPVDCVNRKVDISKTKEMIKDFQPKVIFIDRSEGLVYEDFSWFNNIEGPIKIFDASQYLTNIIAGDYANPFEMGFDYILSTMHKNLPGPQRALICCKNENEIWYQLKSGISTFVSNMHFHSIYSAGLLLKNFQSLKALSGQMLKNTILLDRALQERGVPIVTRETAPTSPNTHHIWISAPSREKAFKWYTSLESVGVLVNYRKLPYELGYGLRLGLSAATYRGLKENHIEDLAEIVALSLKAPSENLNKDLHALLGQIDKEN